MTTINYCFCVSFVFFVINIMISTMNFMRYTFTFFVGVLSLVAVSSLHSQYDPQIQWSEIKTEHYRVVYPKGYEKRAEKIAQDLETAYLYTARELTKHKPITVILDTQENISNGYVTLAPRYSRFYHVPSTDLYYQDWDETLALHEGRHIAQFDSMNTGGGFGAYILFGENGLGAMISFAFPRWVLEGDSIMMETAYTAAGRGRYPGHMRKSRTQAILDEMPGYMTVSSGSHARVLPDPYEMGALLMAYLRTKYGSRVISSILYYTASNSLNPFALHAVVREYTGIELRTHFQNMIAEYGTYWKKDDQSRKALVIEPLNQKQRGLYTNYLFVMQGEGDSVIALKEGQEQTPHLVSIDAQGREKPLRDTGVSRFHLSSGTNLIAWTENRANLRWRGNTSQVFLYNRQTGKTFTLDYEASLFEPDVSADDKFVAGMEHSASGECYLNVVEIATAKAIRQIKCPGEDTWFWPVFDESGSVVLIRSGRKGKYIDRVDIKSGRVRTLLGPVMVPVERVRSAKEWIFFQSSRDGVENIYALSPKGRIFQVTNSRFGAVYPEISPDRKWVYYSDYTIEGFNAVRAAFDSKAWKPLSLKEFQTIRGLPYDPAALVEGGSVDIFEKKVSLDVKEEPYNYFADMINIHSWSYLYDSTGLFELLLYSQNLMQDLQLSPRYRFNDTEDLSYGELSLTYSGLYPVFEIDIGFGRNSMLLDAGGVQQLLAWDGLEVSANMTLPFELSSGKQESLIYFGVGSSYISQANSAIDFTTASGYDHEAVPVQYFAGFDFLSYGSLSLFSPYPYFGVNLLFNYRHLPWSVGLGDSEMAGVKAQLLFPGFFYRNEIRLSGGYDQLLSGSPLFSSLLDLPLGYAEFLYSQMATAEASYRLEFLYPDLDLWLFQLKSISLAPYFQAVYVNPGPSMIRVAGVLFELETTLFLSDIPVFSGFRYQQDIDTNEYLLTFYLRGIFELGFNKR